MKVINNVIPKKYQDQIEKMMLSLEFDWHFLDDITYALNGENDDPKRVEFPDAKGSPGFAHMFYHKPDGVDIMSKHYLFVLPLLLSFVSLFFFLLFLLTSSAYIAVVAIGDKENPP